MTFFADYAKMKRNTKEMRMDSSQPLPENSIQDEPPGPEPLPPLATGGSQPPEPGALPAQSGLRPRRAFQWRWPFKFMPAFWTVTGILSLLVNAILIVVLISLGNQLFTLKALVQNQLLGGLYQNFILMDQAHIKTTIPVSAMVPAKFVLPLKTNTVVILTEDTLLENAQVVSLSTGGLTIHNAPATIKLATGTRLPVALDLTVPVDQMIPVNLNVLVDIPLAETELHKPFAGLQETVRPYYKLMNELPDNWGDALCGPDGGPWCAWFH